MGLDVLLEILRALEGLSAEVALVWLQGNVNTNVRGDVVALHRCCTARVPLACQIEVVGALPANVPLTDVVLLSVLVSCVKDGRYYREETSPSNVIPDCNISGWTTKNKRHL